MRVELDRIIVSKKLEEPVAIVTFEYCLAAIEVAIDRAMDNSHYNESELGDLLFKYGIGISRGSFYGTEDPCKLIPSARIGAMYLRRRPDAEGKTLYYMNPMPDGWTMIGIVMAIK